MMSRQDAKDAKEDRCMGVQAKNLALFASLREMIL